MIAARPHRVAAGAAVAPGMDLPDIAHAARMPSAMPNKRFAL